jgi:pimeloyl-ACP methyl ester carboxylesterase
VDVETTRASGEFLGICEEHRIWYRFVPGSTPAAVLLHGVGGSSYAMRGLAEPFETAGRATLLVDLRGHGFSDDPPTGGGSSLAEHASDVIAVMEECAIADADIVGHCFGSMIAVRLAATRPDLVRRIVLVSASLHPCDGPRAVVCWKAIGAVGAAFRTLAPRTYHARVQEQYDASVFPRVSDVYLPRMRQDFRHTSFANAVATMMAMSREGLDNEAAGLDAPVLIVHGSRDAWVPWRNPQRSADRIPGARFDLRGGEGHCSLVLRQDSRLPQDVFEFLTA